MLKAFTLEISFIKCLHPEQMAKVSCSFQVIELDCNSLDYVYKTALASERTKQKQPFRQEPEKLFYFAEVLMRQTYNSYDVTLPC